MQESVLIIAFIAIIALAISIWAVVKAYTHKDKYTHETYNEEDREDREDREDKKREDRQNNKAWRRAKIILIITISAIMVAMLIFCIAFYCHEWPENKIDEDFAAKLLRSPPGQNESCKKLIRSVASRSSWSNTTIFSMVNAGLYFLAFFGFLAACGVKIAFSTSGVLFLLTMMLILILTIWLLLSKYRRHLIYHNFYPAHKVFGDGSTTNFMK